MPTFFLSSHLARVCLCVVVVFCFLFPCTSITGELFSRGAWCARRVTVRRSSTSRCNAVERHVCGGTDSRAGRSDFLFSFFFFLVSSSSSSFSSFCFSPSRCGMLLFSRVVVFDASVHLASVRVIIVVPLFRFAIYSPRVRRVSSQLFYMDGMHSFSRMHPNMDCVTSFWLSRAHWNAHPRLSTSPPSPHPRAHCMALRHVMSLRHFLSSQPHL